MIVRWPGRVKPGSSTTYPTAFCDVLPTLGDIAGAKHGPVDGVSILPTLTGRRQPEREFLYWEHDVYDQKSARIREERVLQAVRYRRWKAVRKGPDAPLELYDLRADPGEKSDVAATNPDIVTSIETFLKSARSTPRPHNTGSMKWVS
jgi:arylsulfatase A-like enzyme